MEMRRGDANPQACQPASSGWRWEQPWELPGSLPWLFSPDHKNEAQKGHLTRQGLQLGNGAPLQVSKPHSSRSVLSLVDFEHDSALTLTLGEDAGSHGPCSCFSEASWSSAADAKAECQGPRSGSWLCPLVMPQPDQTAQHPLEWLKLLLSPSPIISSCFSVPLSFVEYINSACLTF